MAILDILRNPKKKCDKLAKLKKHEEALGCYNKALELNPKDEKAWYNKGKILINHGKDQEALKCFDKTLELDPTFEPALKDKKEILEGKIE